MAAGPTGTISADKTKKIVGWADYEKAAKALVEARRAAQAAKSKVKDAMKKTMGEDDLDFVLETNGSVRVYKNLEQKKASTRPTVPDLSSKF